MIPLGPFNCLPQGPQSQFPGAVMRAGSPLARASRTPDKGGPPRTSSRFLLQTGPHLPWEKPLQQTPKCKRRLPEVLLVEATPAASQEVSLISAGNWGSRGKSWQRSTRASAPPCRLGQADLQKGAFATQTNHQRKGHRTTQGCASGAQRRGCLPRGSLGQPAARLFHQQPGSPWSGFPPADEESRPDGCFTDGVRQSFY